MYLNLDTQEEQSEQEIRSLFSNTSFPTPFTPPENYTYIFPAPPPAFDAVTQRAAPAPPELTVKGHWEQRWEVVEVYALTEDRDAAVAAAVLATEAADAVAYQAKRAAEYPSIPDQLDLLYHVGIDGWKAVIQVTKDKYPK